MDIIVKGRHTSVAERFREHVNTKLGKIGKLDQKVIRVDVEVSEQTNHRPSNNRERVELTIRSRGPVIRAEAESGDRYAAFDMAFAKLESRLRKLADRRKDYLGAPGAPSVRLANGNGSGRGAAEREAVSDTAAPPPSPPPVPPAPVEPDVVPPRSAGDDRAVGETDGRTMPIEMMGDGPLVVREKFHRADPMTLDDALLRMEMVGHDFFLFRDRESGRASAVYRRKGYDFGVIRLIESG